MIKAKCSVCGKEIKFENLLDFNEALKELRPGLKCAICRVDWGPKTEQVRTP